MKNDHQERLARRSDDYENRNDDEKDEDSEDQTRWLIFIFFTYWNSHSFFHFSLNHNFRNDPNYLCNKSGYFLIIPPKIRFLLLMTPPLLYYLWATNTRPQMWLIQFDIIS